MTTNQKGRIKQETHILHGGLTDSQIRQKVMAGVPIECFEAVPTLTVDGQKQEMDKLKAFQVKAEKNVKMLQPTTRTKLVPFEGQAPGVVIIRQNAENNDSKIVKLVKSGVDFATAEALVTATAEALEELDYKAAGKALGLKGNYGAGKVYESIHGQ